jgi:hypothetical protein
MQDPGSMVSPLNRCGGSDDEPRRTFMNLQDAMRAFQDDASILQRIASKYGQPSTEYAALWRAGLALWYVSIKDYEGFDEFVRKCESGLTPEQRSHLTSIGIDPDRDSASGEQV